MMTSIIRRYPLSSFWVLAFLIGAFANALRMIEPGFMGPLFKQMMDSHTHMNLITGFEASLNKPIAFTLLLFPAAPAIAALICALVGYGMPGVRELLGRLKPWRAPVQWRDGVLVFLIVWVLFLATAGMFWMATFMVGPPGALERNLMIFGSTPIEVVGMLTLSLFISAGPLLEELGWRGYALPRLLERYDGLTAAIILGLMWEFWHLPRDVPLLLSGAPGSVSAVLLKQIQIMPGFIFGTIISVYLYNRLGGSAWGGILAHALHNEIATNVLQAWAPAVEFFGIRLRYSDLVEDLLGLLILLLAGRALGGESKPQIKYAHSENTGSA